MLPRLGTFERASIDSRGYLQINPDGSMSQYTMPGNEAAYETPQANRGNLRGSRRRRLGGMSQKALENKSSTSHIFGRLHKPRKTDFLLDAHFVDNIDCLYSAQTVKVYHTGSPGDYEGNFNNAMNYVNNNGSLTNQSMTFGLLPMVTQLRLRFSNAYTGAVKIAIYTLVPREDMITGADPLSMWGQVIASDQENNANVEPADLYSTPFMSNKLTCRYKILKTTRFTMMGGTYHEHVMRMCRKYPVKKDYIFDVATTIKKKLSVFTMITIHGLPGHDLTTTTLVGTNKAGVDIIGTTSYRYRMDRTFTRRHFTSFALGTTPANMVIATDVTVQNDDQIV